MPGNNSRNNPPQPIDITVTYAMDAEANDDGTISYFAVVAFDEGDVWAEDTIDLTPRKWGHEIYECAREMIDRLELAVRGVNIIRDPAITLH